MAEAAFQGTATKPGNAVSAAALEALLPELPGWEKLDVISDEGDMLGAPYAQTQCRYERGGVSITLEIMDAVMVQSMLAAFSMAAQSDYSETTNEGYRKGFSVGGHPGWEEWQEKSRSGQASVLVGGRFIVTASGSDLANTEPVKQVAQAVNVSQLASLK
jgi:hypothetical protein